MACLSRCTAPILPALFAVLCGVACAASPATAHRASAERALRVERALGPAPKGVEDLKFAEMFKSPVGPAGLEPSEKLRRLDGRRVRMVGYMVRDAAVTPGAFLLSPLPVAVGDEDEAYADDIPPTALHVVLPRAQGTPIALLPGLVRIIGTLQVGASEVAGSDRIATARIVVDADFERALIRLGRMPDARVTPARAAR